MFRYMWYTWNQIHVHKPYWAKIGLESSWYCQPAESGPILAHYGISSRISSLREKDRYLTHSHTNVILVKRKKFHSWKNATTSFILPKPFSVQTVNVFGNGCLSIPSNANRLGRSNDQWQSSNGIENILFTIQVGCQNWRHCWCEFDITILNNKSVYKR